MGVKPDHWIRRMARECGMIEPFEASQVREVEGHVVLSYGTSSYGYDVRCANEFRLFTPADGATLDPKDFDEGCLVPMVGDACVISPNSFALGRTLEYFRIPRDILVLCLGKSTYARCGIAVNVTPLEPEWEGHVTLVFANHASCPVKIHASEGVAQLIFLGADGICETSYADRGGKYQGQRGVTLPKA